MELKEMTVFELIDLYSEVIKEMKKRGVLRTNNVVGEIGEFYVIEKYNSDKVLSALSCAPVGTKNINAVDKNGERYSIKSTTGNVTGAVYGLQPPGSSTEDKPLFEYIVICKMDDNYDLEGIYQLTWEQFVKHKKWHKRINAWNLTLTAALKKDSVIIYEKEKKQEEKSDNTNISNNYKDIKLKEKTNRIITTKKTEETKENKSKIKAVSWGKTPFINHAAIRDKVADLISRKIGVEYKNESHSRYVSQDRKKALYIMSSKFSERNREYWYSINDENIPWMELFDECYVAFAMGSADHVLVFQYSEIKEMLKGCLRTSTDETIGKKAHYHFAFAVEGKKHIYFKKKLPQRDFVDVTDSLLENLK